MKITGKLNLEEDASKHSDAKNAIKAWIKVVQCAKWKNLMEVKETLSRSVDYVQERTVFNIKGNNYRLIVRIDYELQIVAYEAFLTHAEYDNYKF